jgi:hypothetical protein
VSAAMGDTTQKASSLPVLTQQKQRKFLLDLSAASVAAVTWRSQNEYTCGLILSGKRGEEMEPSSTHN